MGNRLLTLTNRAPEQNWINQALKPKSRAGRLFCQTLLPRKYRLILHNEGKAEAFASTGKPLGPVEGNLYHRKYGQKVVQIDPGHARTQTIFLHVLTAVETSELIPPEATYRMGKHGQIELTVSGTTTRLVVPEWFAQTR
jgi:hypothetical protein